MNSLVKISASLSCVDLLNLKSEIENIEKSDIDFIHYDVVDGEFNDCFVFGDITLQKVRKIVKKPIEVHLGVNDIEKYLNPFVRAGADYIAVHYESMKDPFEIFKKIRILGPKPVLAFKADTDVPHNFIDMAKEVEWILKLTVNPGYAGQTIQLCAIEHIRKMRRLLKENCIDIPIQADGNINKDTVPLVTEAGADILTGGSSGLFNKKSTLFENIRILKNCARKFKD